MPRDSLEGTVSFKTAMAAYLVLAGALAVPSVGVAATLYGVDNYPGCGFDDENCAQLAAVDPDSRSGRVVGDLNTYLGMDVRDLAYRRGGALYAAGTSSFGVGGALLKINLRNGASAVALDFGEECEQDDSCVDALEFDDNGTLYGNSFAKGLLTIDLETGATTPVGQVSRGIFGNLAFGGGKLFSFSREVVDDDVITHLVTVDRSTGAVKNVGEIDRFFRALTYLNGLLYSVDDMTLYTLDPLTAVSTPVGPIGGLPEFERINSLAAVPLPAGIPLLAAALALLYAVRRTGGRQRHNPTQAAANGGALSL